MGLIEGTTSVKSVTAEYDFTKDGGTIGNKTLRGAVNGNESYLPAGSVVTGGFIDVLTAFTSASTNTGTVALKAEQTDDLYAAAAVSGTLNTTGRKSIVPVGSGATMIKTTANRPITMSVAVAALTAGKFRVTLFYV